MMPENLTTLLASGGPVVALLLFLSVAATALLLLKLWQFASLGVGRHAALRKALALWSEGRAEEAARAASAARSPAAKVFSHVLKLSPGTAIDRAREDAERVASDELRFLRRHLRAIEVIAQSAPLLGLFGTVIGMIEVFRQLQASGASADPASLAGGIWTALLATAMGLGVAIVFSAAGAWLEGAVENERSVMESALSGLFARYGTPRS